MATVQEVQALLQLAVARADGLRYKIQVLETELLEVKAARQSLVVANADAQEEAEGSIQAVRVKAEAARVRAKAAADRREAKLKTSLAAAHALVVDQGRKAALATDRALQFEGRLARQVADSRWAADQLPELVRLRVEVESLRKDKENLVKILILAGGRLP